MDTKNKDDSSYEGVDPHLGVATDHLDGDGAIVTLGLDVYSVHPGGLVLREPSSSAVYAHWPYATLLTGPETTTVAHVDGIPIMAGVTVVVGGTDVGKTPLAMYIQQQTDADHIRYGEPLAGFSRSLDVVARGLLLNKQPVVVVDSFKNLVGRVPGGLMASGLSREFFVWLSDLSSFMAERGVAVVAVVNIASTSPAVVAEATAALKTHVVSVWTSNDNGTVDWSCRTGEGLPRLEGTKKIMWDVKPRGVRKLVDVGLGNAVRGDAGAAPTHAGSFTTGTLPVRSAPQDTLARSVGRLVRNIHKSGN